jgi:subtilisin family serine protease
MQPSQGPPEENLPQSPQEAQLQLIIREFGGAVARGPENWRDTDTGTHFLYRQGYVLVREEYVSQARGLLPLARPSDADADAAGAARAAEEPVFHGLRRLRLSDGADVLEACRTVRDGITRNGVRVSPGLGAGVCTPDHLVHICGDAYNCPAAEPEPVASGTSPDPALSDDRAAGAGIRVVVVDTGLDPEAPATHSWLRGVTGDPDVAVQPPTLLPYAGHGTFIAGVVRCMAPQAEVVVRAILGRQGAMFESDLVGALDRVLAEDAPDIISMSAGTYTWDATGLLSLTVFYETRLRHHKGVALVVAAGNDGDRRSFWPAAAPWTVSVGALGADWRSRANFSNFGGWVDVYAPGANLINAYPTGAYSYQEPPHSPGDKADFTGMASWSGTSFSTPVVSGLVAARMSRTGENGQDAAAALVKKAQSQAQPGVGAVLLPE